MNLAAISRIAGATARLTRLIYEDDVPGQWWIKGPIDAAMQRYAEQNTRVTPRDFNKWTLTTEPAEQFDEPWWWKYRDGLDCPWCVSVHVAFWMVLIENALPNKGKVRRLWNIGTGALALSYVTARAETLLDGIGDEY